MLQVSPEPVQFPEHERVAGLQRLEAGGETRTGVMAPGGEILVDPTGFHAGAE
jgi:hypothetical protein